VIMLMFIAIFWSWVGSVISNICWIENRGRIICCCSSRRLFSNWGGIV